MNFRLKQDWYIEDFFDRVKIYEKGKIFRPGEDGKYLIENPSNSGKATLSFEDMLKANDNGTLLFEIIDQQNIELLIEEVKDEDNEIKNWRIQLDVKTSLKNLKKIENFIKENIQELL